MAIPATPAIGPAPVAGDLREALRQVLKTSGILYSTPSQPIRHRNGDISPWAFYSWNASLTSEGLRLAALVILDRLRSYEATQLVSFGYTAMPLLSAVVLLGEGRYTGAAIREKRKTYLSCRRIEGPFDPSRPSIVIDDSLSSGKSLNNAIQAVEDEGGEVEGSIALVHFPFRGGIEFGNSHGYRAETIFDIWRDLEMTPEEPPSDRHYAAIMRSERFPDGLHPAVLARKVAECYLTTGSVPQPPRALDREYDARGGTFVSIRRKLDDFRLARDGDWHFDPSRANAPRDVVTAVIDTMRSGAGQFDARSLTHLKFAVTFFGALEPITPRQLDFDRYGIVVRGKVLPNKRGGALPNTEVFISEIEQYRHARVVNAKIEMYEPHELYRHTIEKFAEPGEPWLPYGVPEGPQRQIGGATAPSARSSLTRRALFSAKWGARRWRPA